MAPRLRPGPRAALSAVAYLCLLWPLEAAGDAGHDHADPHPSPAPPSRPPAAATDGVTVAYVRDGNADIESDGDGVPLNAIAYSAIPESLTVGAADGTVTVFEWDHHDGPGSWQEDFSYYHGANTSVTTITQAAGYIATGGLDRRLLIYSRIKGEEVSEVDFAAPINALAWANPSIVLVGCADGVLGLVSPFYSQVVRVPTGYPEITTIAALGHGDQFAVGTAGGNFILYNAEAFPPKATYEGPPRSAHDAAVSALALSPNATRLASGGGDSKVVMWSLERDPPAKLFTLTLAAPVNSVTFAADGSHIAVADTTSAVSIFDARSGERVGLITSVPSVTTGLAADRNGFVAATDDGSIYRLLIPGGVTIAPAPAAEVTDVPLPPTTAPRPTGGTYAPLPPKPDHFATCVLLHGDAEGSRWPYYYKSHMASWVSADGAWAIRKPSHFDASLWELARVEHADGGAQPAAYRWRHCNLGIADPTGLAHAHCCEGDACPSFMDCHNTTTLPPQEEDAATKAVRGLGGFAMITLCNCLCVLSYLRWRRRRRAALAKRRMSLSKTEDSAELEMCGDSNLLAMSPARAAAANLRVDVDHTQLVVTPPETPYVTAETAGSADGKTPTGSQNLGTSRNTSKGGLMRGAGFSVGGSMSQHFVKQLKQAQAGGGGAPKPRRGSAPHVASGSDTPSSGRATETPPAVATPCQNTSGSDNSMSNLLPRNDTDADVEYTPSYVETLRPIGHGAYGTVFLAAHKVTQEQVAVKKFSTTASVENELKMLRRLRHPRIVALKGFHLDDMGKFAEAFLYLEYVSGGSLYDLVQHNGGRLFEPSIRRLVKDAVWGLQYLHSQGVIHRDIKPHNLLIDGAGHVKVADFGCCKETADGTVSRVQGTPNYMAPEAFHGKATFYSDIWSVGATVCELASGTPPWKEAGQVGLPLMFHIAHRASAGGHPVIPDTLSPAAQADLARCFATQPSDRFTCDALLQSQLLLDVGIPLPGQETIDQYNASRVDIISKKVSTPHGTSTPHGVEDASHFCKFPTPSHGTAASGTGGAHDAVGGVLKGTGSSASPRSALWAASIPADTGTMVSFPSTLGARTMDFPRCETGLSDAPAME